MIVSRLQGMVDAGETVSVTLKREFGEEALNSIDIPDKERKSTEKEIAALFKHGYEVRRTVPMDREANGLLKEITVSVLVWVLQRMTEWHTLPCFSL